MATDLVCQIAKQMAGIHLTYCPTMSLEDQARKLEVIYGKVDGAYNAELQFLAEPRMFVRMATNMIGGEPEDDQEVWEYAAEFFNVLCGRFISELHHATKVAGRFHPPSFEATGAAGEHNEMNELFFISDEQEVAMFSWTATPINDLLRRSKND
jgi:CheY-specific phosphatase CheX